jgi:hypothetical protein
MNAVAGCVGLKVDKTAKLFLNPSVSFKFSLDYSH